MHNLGQITGFFFPVAKEDDLYKHKAYAAIKTQYSQK